MLREVDYPLFFNNGEDTRDIVLDTSKGRRQKVDVINGYITNTPILRLKSSWLALT